MAITHGQTSFVDKNVPTAVVTLSLIAALYSPAALASVAAPSYLGYLDAPALASVKAGELEVSGWACRYNDADPVTVQVYAHVAGRDAVKISSTTANLVSEPAVQAACNLPGSNSGHRFLAPISSAQIQHYAGWELYATINGSQTRLGLNTPSPPQIPSGAGSNLNVNKTTGFNLLVDCSVNQGLYCSSNGGSAYGYAASIIHSGGYYHMFFCSQGGGLTNGWDAIRYSRSTDGKHWTVPLLAVMTTGAVNRDLAACDPSVVFYQGYFYMFYGSAYVSPKGNLLTVMQVARARNIEGPWTIFARGGTWGATASDPPQIIVLPFQDLPDSYGAGQPSVIVHHGKLQMWYTDDTFDAGNGNIFMLTSSEPTVWPKPSASDLTNTGEVNVDVKYDQAANRFAMYSLDNIGNQEIVQVRYSSAAATRGSGLVWTPPTMIDLPNNPFCFFGQNIGVSGDQSGYLLDEPLLVTYMAPYLQVINTPAGRDLSGQSTQGEWNLYGAFAP